MAEETVDVLIIGSGHSGGMAAKILTEKGISCLMLNAGPVADAHKDTELKPAYALPFRGFKQPGRLPHVFQSNEFDANTWVDEHENSPIPTIRNILITGYGCGSSEAARSFGRGSRSGSATMKFKGKSHDGFGDDWPISLADLAPYYSRVEGIFPGSRTPLWAPAVSGWQFRPSMILPGRGACSGLSRRGSNREFRSAKRAAPWASMD